MKTLQSIICAASLILLAASAQAADTLVVKDGASFKPGAATSWKATGNTVVLQLRSSVDGAAVAEQLAGQLAGVKVSFDKGELTITGMPEETLLDRLATIPLGDGGADPLAALTDLGGGVAASDDPEGGGSIRASKPTTALATRVIEKHNPQERFEAEVLEVKQGAFPEVTLKLKLRRQAKAGPLKKKMRWGKVIEVTVVYVKTAGGVDFASSDSQRNLLAWYLERGDRIIIHPIAVGNTFEIDWLARK